MMYHIIASAVELVIMKDIGWLNFFKIFKHFLRNIGYLFGQFDTSFYSIFYDELKQIIINNIYQATHVLHFHLAGNCCTFVR